MKCVIDKYEESAYCHIHNVKNNLGKFVKFNFESKMAKLTCRFIEESRANHLSVSYYTAFK